MQFLARILAGGALVAAAASASATVVVLDFEGVSSAYPFDTPIAIGGFYNGGTSAAGTSGSNYGIAFDSNADAICLNTAGIECSGSSRGPGVAHSTTAGLVLSADGETIIDYADGFSEAFSFVYSQPYVFGDQLGAAYIYSGPGGTGTLLGIADLGLTESTCGDEYAATWCPFFAVGIDFTGTAHSVVLYGMADYLTFDDLTFGSSTPGVRDDSGSIVVPPGVPEPATWAMLVLGFGFVGFAARSRRHGRRALAQF